MAVSYTHLSKRIWTKADSPIKATAEIAGDKATWKFESVPSGKEVLGYVLMKVVQNETQEITNQITINNDKATKTNTVKQKKDEEKMEVTKTASAEPIVDGKEEYTITIKNTGTAAASGWKFSDVLPAGMELDGTVAKVTIEGGRDVYKIQLYISVWQKTDVINLHSHNRKGQHKMKKYDLSLIHI